MSETGPNSKNHEQYCATRIPKVALIFVSFSAVAATLSWIGLNSAPKHHNLIELPAYLLVIFMGAKFIAYFQCAEEKVTAALIMASFVIATFTSFYPGSQEGIAAAAKFARAALLSVAFLCSVYMLFRSFLHNRNQLGTRKSR
jgi:hypothetical protein